MTYKVSNPRKLPVFSMKNAFKLVFTAIIVGACLVGIAGLVEVLGAPTLANVIGWTGVVTLSIGGLGMAGYMIHEVWSGM